MRLLVGLNLGTLVRDAVDATPFGFMLAGHLLVASYDRKVVP